MPTPTVAMKSPTVVESLPMVQPLPVVQPPSPVIIPTPKVVKPKHKVFEDPERPVTPQELQEADEYLKLGSGFRPAKEIDTVHGVRELRKAILEGRVKATEQRKRELGLSSEVRVSTPSAETKIKTKYTKEQFEKYLETARRLDEQKRERLAEIIADVIKGE
jgi:hypothetical protein